MKSSEVRGKGREAEGKYGDHVIQTRGIRDPVGKSFMDHKYHNRGRRSFVEVISGKEAAFQQSKLKDGHLVLLRFFPNEEGLSRFQKAFIGIIENSGLTYRMQDIFHARGYFFVKVTPLGENLCLLEEHEDGELKALMEEA